MKAFDDLMKIARIEPVGTRQAAMRDWLRLYVERHEVSAHVQTFAAKAAVVDIKALEDQRARAVLAKHVAENSCVDSGWQPDPVMGDELHYKRLTVYTLSAKPKGKSHLF